MARGRFQKKRSPLGPILIILVLAAIAAAVLYFTGVLGHRHHCSAPADCTVARYCDECGKLMEAAHQDHTAGPAATCETPQTCTVCGKELAPATGHTPGPEATCAAPQTCTVCGKELAPATEHVADESVNCALPTVCKFCGKEMGEATGHDFVKSDDGMTETCSKCGQVIHRSKSTVDQEILPETQASGHFHNDIDAFEKNNILVCGDYAVEYFKLDETGSDSYAKMVSDFAAKYPDVHVTSLLIPKACAFYPPLGYDDVLENQAAFIQATYDSMGDGVTKADCIGVLKEHIGEYTYYRTDHHWTSLGAYYASQAYCAANGITARTLGSYKTIVNCGYIGSLYSFAGEPAQLKQNPDYTVAHLPETGYTMTCTTGGSTFEAKAINEEASGYAEAFMSGDQAFTDIKTENKNGKKLLIFKESYGNAFAPYMIDYYEEIIVIDIRQETASIASMIDEYGITDALIINNVQGALSLRDNLQSKLTS